MRRRNRPPKLDFGRTSLTLAPTLRVAFDGDDALAGPLGVGAVVATVPLAPLLGRTIPLGADGGSLFRPCTRESPSARATSAEGAALVSFSLSAPPLGNAVDHFGATSSTSTGVACPRGLCT